MSNQRKFEKQLRGIVVPKRRAATIADVERLAGGGGGGPVAWGDVTGKPSEFAPSLHGHSIADVTGLAAALGLMGGSFTLDDGNASSGGGFTLNDGAP